LSDTMKMCFESCAPVAQGIERLPPEQKVGRSNRLGRIFYSLSEGQGCTLPADSEGLDE
jgi:hypothetical protein